MRTVVVVITSVSSCVGALNTTSGAGPMGTRMGSSTGVSAAGFASASDPASASTHMSPRPWRTVPRTLSQRFESIRESGDSSRSLPLASFMRGRMLITQIAASADRSTKS